MTMTRFTYIIRARPKVKAADEVMDIVNKNLKDFGVEETVHYNAEIGRFSFQLDDDEKQEENRKKVLDTTKEVLEEKHLSDVTFRLESKKPV